MEPVDLGDLVADLQRGVERACGILVDHRQAGAAPPAEIALAHPREVTPVHADRTGVDAAVPGQVAHERQGQRGLPGPGLADEPVCFPGVDRERDARHHGRPLARPAVGDREPRDLERRRRHSARVLRSPSAARLMPTTRVARATAGASTVHGAICTNARSTATVSPQSGDGGWMPN